MCNDLIPGFFFFIATKSLYTRMHIRHCCQLFYIRAVITEYVPAIINKVILAGRDRSVGISTRLLAGRCGDRIPMGGEIFRTHPDRLRGPPSLNNGYRVIPGDKAAEA